jgi:serine O-acetyltransferase
MPQRTHPHDPHISNGMLARALIWITRKRIPIFRRLFTAYLNCDIGGPLPKSTFLPHPFGIVVTTSAIIGEDVVIGHQVTIGNRNGIMSAPTIGNRVYIGAGAKILGPVTIGEDAIIGANAVITKDVPAARTVVGSNRLLD